MKPQIVIAQPSDVERVARGPSRRSLAWAARIADFLNGDAASEAGDYRGMRVDADETNMLALALEQMRTKVYEAEYPELKARMILPVAGDIDPGAETFAYEEQDYSGDAKIISGNGYADDPPSIETKSIKRTHGIVSIGNGYTYSIQDLRRAAFSGRPLEARKALAQRRIFERKVDEIAAIGAPNDGIPDGIANRATGTGSGQIRSTGMTAASWDASPVAAGGSGMVDDLNAAVAAFIADSKEFHEPTTLVLPTISYLRLHHTYTTDGNPEPAAKRFLDSNGFVREILPWNVFSAIDGGGANDSRGLLLKRDPDVLEIVIPQEFEVLPPQPHNFAFKVLAHGRTAGTCIYRPLGLRYLTGLPTA